ncbi:L,D-transpeptidase catalytic domain protein [Lachnoanaerobaculum saburreum F0468]|jgi:hypothetical protein|uniref:L,D-transpeptidase catalytic domain protein n=2 Tax=Lachnoanaerobaculum saburreum TaxID=467210 RepID=I0R7M6_9FIRM|nr:L,D-transpeptidase [Lachnoanaerobaculum saburreum]EFU77787.1 ErfK/YbiS/YcfS/YnhG family protein [Lachnoanaerobaculum saburreum DSM 3986]EIC95684.1 L,D-transpeptidase catalytic domain protein [Lachnoanaerobaculum saburreum F0468]RKW48817.1 MAG: peptidase [Lachnospiraceae bacterium]
MKIRKSFVAAPVLSMLIGLMSFNAYAATVRKVTTSSYTPVSLQQSVEPSTRIYVSKMSKELTLIADNKVVGKWPCSLGEFSANGTKKKQGDRTTPNGDYYICVRNDKSAYHLSLGLSYPDKAAADRGFESGIISKEEKDTIYSAIDRKVCPPWDTALGGAIMIHGNYQKGIPTAGCVAVSDDVMDILWPYGQLGIKVSVGP